MDELGGKGDILHQTRSGNNGTSQQRAIQLEYKKRSQLVLHVITMVPALLRTILLIEKYDDASRQKIMRLFAELNKRVGTTILIATHDLELIREFEAPVLRLSNGMLVRDVEHGAVE